MQTGMSADVEDRLAGLEQARIALIEQLFINSGRRLHCGAVSLHLPRQLPRPFLHNQDESEDRPAACTLVEASIHLDSGMLRNKTSRVSHVRAVARKRK